MNNKKDSTKKNLDGLAFLVKIKNRSKNPNYNPLNFFKRFIKTAVDDIRSKTGSIGLNKNVEKALISEIQKKTGVYAKKKKQITDTPDRSDQTRHVTIRKNTLGDFLSSQPERSIECILFCLKSLKNFNDYVKFNTITYEQLEKISAYLKHEYVPKGTILYTKGKKPKRFFGVIQGNISLRIYDRILIKESRRKFSDLFSDSDSSSSDNDKLNDELDDKKKYEMIRRLKKFVEIGNYTQGMCFGEWDLINNKFYNDTAIATQNTDIFYLDKVYFDRFISTQICRADLERKIFVTQRIPILSLEMVCNKPEFYKNGNIIYTEFDKAEDAILIYNGAAAIVKLNGAKSKIDIYERQEQLKIISKIERGGLAGLEIGKESENGENYYDNTLMVTEDNTVLFRININMFRKKNKAMEKNLRAFFNKLYVQQNDFIKNLEELKSSSKKRHEELSEEQKTNISIKNLFLSISNSNIRTKEAKVSLKKLKVNSISKFNNKTDYKKFKIFTQNKTRNLIQSQTLPNNNTQDKLRYFTINKKIRKNQEKKLLVNKEKNDLLEEFKSLKIHKKTKTCESININHTNNHVIKNLKNSIMLPAFKTNNEIKNNHNETLFKKSQKRLKKYELIKNCFNNENINTRYINTNHNRYESFGENLWNEENKNYENKKYNDLFIFRNKYSYDSGQFKIPLMSFEDIATQNNINIESEKYRYKNFNLYKSNKKNKYKFE